MSSLRKSAAARMVRVTSIALASSILLTACSEDDLILPGKRESVVGVIDPEAVAAEQAFQNQVRPISLPAVTSNANWPQAPGTPAFRADHPALNAPLTQIWSANIGEGDSRKQRITAAPVVMGGLIYTLDSDAQVTATSTAGQTVWQTDVRPARDKSGQATGGGLAYDSGRLYVTVGYGSLVALDAETGGEVWRQRLEGTGSGAPTIVDGLIYLTSGDDRGWALDAENGRLLWQVTASPDVNNVLGAPAPAVADGLAIFAFGSGEVQAVFRRGGLRRWDASVSGERPGAALGAVGDVTAPPTVSGNSVYIGNLSGRTVALELQSGARRWTLDEGAFGNVVAAGDSVFLVSDQNQLMRVSAADGSRVWAVDLPKFVNRKPRRRAEVVAHHGPILAGGRIIVASNDGLIRSFDPTSGALLESVEIPGGASSQPVVAGGVLYVLSSKGKLHAFR